MSNPQRARNSKGNDTRGYYVLSHGLCKYISSIILLLASLSLCSCHSQKRNLYKWNPKDYFQEPRIQQLCDDIDAGKYDAFVELINGDKATASTLGKDNMTLLLWAYHSKDDRFFKKLLELDADPNVYFLSDFGTNGNLEPGQSVTQLIAGDPRDLFYDTFKAKGDVNLRSKEYVYNNQTPLFFVMRSGCPDSYDRVKYLISKKAEIRAKGIHPLVGSASLPCRLKVTLLLLENGADPNAVDDNTEKTFVQFMKTRTVDDYQEQKEDYYKVVEFINRLK